MIICDQTNYYTVYTSHPIRWLLSAARGLLTTGLRRRSSRIGSQLESNLQRQRCCTLNGTLITSDFEVISNGCSAAPQTPARSSRLHTTGLRRRSSQMRSGIRSHLQHQRYRIIKRTLITSDFEVISNGCPAASSNTLCYGRIDFI